MHTTSGLACREGSRGASCGALVGGRASTTHSPAQLPPAGRGGQHRSRGLRSNLSAQAGPQLHQKPEQSDAASPLEQGTSLSTWELGARCMLERLYASEEQPATSWLSAPMMVTLDERPQVKRNQDRSPDYFANVGDAIRTLREDYPSLFYKDLNYSIYRDDIVFRDPRNKFDGMKNYKLIFWSLRFHGKIFFTKLYVEVKRIWQPTDDVIKMRWTVHGVPRVPWEAEGLFDGISTYKLDNHGRIYEHQVDNVLLRDPPMLTNPPLLAGLNLVPGSSQTPVPGAWFEGGDAELAPSSLASAAAALAASAVAQGVSAQQQLLSHHHHHHHHPSSTKRMATQGSAHGSEHQQGEGHALGMSHASVQGSRVSSNSNSSSAGWLPAYLSKFSWVRLYAALVGSLALVRAVAGGAGPGGSGDHTGAGSEQGPPLMMI